jgi:hypothetical protein
MSDANGNIVSPVTGRVGIIVGRTPLGDVIQDYQEWRAPQGLSISYTNVTLQCAFQRCDGRGALLSSADGAIRFPNSLAQHLILLGAAVQA